MGVIRPCYNLSWCLDDSRHTGGIMTRTLSRSAFTFSCQSGLGGIPLGGPFAISQSVMHWPMT